MTASTLFLGCQRGGSTVAHLVLPSGAVALIDDADAALLADACWWEDRRTNTSYVRGQRRGEAAKLRLHRVIVGAAAGDIVDHINGDGLDNRRANLRICTPSQNSCNRARTKGREAPIGVWYDRRRQNWRAEIYVNTKRHHLGVFPTREAAATARSDAELRLHGEFSGALR